MEEELADVQGGKRSRRVIDNGEQASNEVASLQQQCFQSEIENELTSAGESIPGGRRLFEYQIDHIRGLALAAMFEDYGPGGDYNKDHAADARSILREVRSMLPDLRPGAS